jgi:hypothetical protein
MYKFCLKDIYAEYYYYYFWYYYCHHKDIVRPVYMRGRNEKCRQYVSRKTEAHRE